MPTGKVKWYDSEKGFGFVQSDDGDEVFLHATVLPAGTLTLKPGTRVEFGIADGKRGPQALSIRVLDPLPSVAKASRKDAEALAVQLEDLIVLIDRAANELKRGRYPQDAAATRLAAILRERHCRSLFPCWPSRVVVAVRPDCRRTALG